MDAPIGTPPESIRRAHREGFQLGYRRGAFDSRTRACRYQSRRGQRLFIPAIVVMALMTGVLLAELGRALGTHAVAQVSEPLGPSAHTTALVKSWYAEINRVIAQRNQVVLPADGVVVSIGSAVLPVSDAVLLGEVAQLVAVEAGTLLLEPGAGEIWVTRELLGGTPSRGTALLTAGDGAATGCCGGASYRSAEDGPVKVLLLTLGSAAAFTEGVEWGA